MADGGTINWTGGSIIGAVTVASNAVLNLTGSNYKPLYAPLTNAGTINWSGTGNVQVYNTAANPYPGKVFNLTGGVFNILNDQTMYSSGAVGFFDNASTVRKSAGTGSTYLDLAIAK